jgi:hypothetical protein
VSVHVGDLNGDGRLDLAVADASEGPGRVGSVAVLLGRGDGTFAAELEYAVGSSTSNMDIGDLNGDGRLDLAVAVECFVDVQFCVSVLLNTCFSAPELTGGGGAGGNGAGGGANGGSGGAGGTGGTTPVCETVTALPATGTACISPGRSLCLPSGDRCFCARGIWMCNTECARDYPMVPTPGSACNSGAICTYSGGQSCLCRDSQWKCLGVDGCPAEMPSGSCSGLTGLECDYPNSSSSDYHYGCACGEPYAGTSPLWLCHQVGGSYCPATQPPYSLTTPCPGYRLCGYGDTYCQCLGNGMPWICGPGAFVYWYWGCFPLDPYASDSCR